MEVSEWNEDSELQYLTHWMPLPPLPGSADSAQADSVTAPAGWRLVPIEPSLNQEWDGKEASSRVSTMAEACKIYKAMLAAAPTPPAQATGGVLEDAARYRWLRQHWFTMLSNYQRGITFKLGEPRWSDITEAELDAAIDAARKQGGA